MAVTARPKRPRARRAKAKPPGPSPFCLMLARADGAAARPGARERGDAGEVQRVRGGLDGEDS